MQVASTADYKALILIFAGSTIWAFIASNVVLSSSILIPLKHTSCYLMALLWLNLN